MANPFTSFIQLLSFNDEYDDIDDEYDDDAYEQKKLARIRERDEAKQQKQIEKMERKERKASQAAASYSYDEPAEPAPRKERASRSYSNDKIVPLSSGSGRGFEVSLFRPNNISDAQDACDMLLSGNAVIINLEGNEIERAQGIMDFISGCIYAIKGNMHQISKYNFIFSPANIDISGDYFDIAAEEGITIPTLDEEF